MFGFLSSARLTFPSLALSSAALFSPFSSSLRRLYRFLFRRLLGQLVSAADVDLASLDVHLASGDVHLHSLHLHPDLLSSASNSLPLILTSATIEHVHAHVPWTQLLTQPCTLHIRGLRATLAPRARTAGANDEAATEDAAGGGGGSSSSSLASSVLGALSDSLQSLDPDELREQLAMHRQLADSLTRTGRTAQVGDERERRTAERERKSHTAADGAAADSAPSASSPLPAHADVASAGLQVVASFLERVVSTTELSMEDVSLTLECPHPREEERLLHLSLHINSLTYADAEADYRSQPPREEESSTSSALPALGPAFVYRKRVHVHGFRVTLSEPLKDSTGAEDDGGGQEVTIAHADVDQHCEVRLDVDMQGGAKLQPDASATGEDGADGSHAPATVDAAIQLRALRGLLAPHQVELLRAVAEAVGESSHIAARQVETQRQRQQRSKCSGADSRPGQAAPSRPQRQRCRSAREASPPLPLAAAAAGSAASSLPSLRLWSVEVSVSYASLTVLEEDEEVPNQWWLQPVVIPASSHPLPSTLLSPLISNISVDHLLLSVRHAHLQVTQTSTRSTAAFTLHRLSVFEYLQQFRLMLATMPTLHHTAQSAATSPLYEEQQQRMGFSARRLLSLGDSNEEEEEQEEGGAEADGDAKTVHAELDDFSRADLHGEVESAVVGLLPLPSGPQSASVPMPVASAAVASRCCIHLAPAQLDVDLGVLSRLDALAAALTSCTTPPSGLELPRSISGAAAVPASSSSPSSAFLLSAPRLRVQLQFPADTPSQSGVSTPLMSDGVQGCFDSRGKVRGERLEAELDHSHIWRVDDQRVQRSGATSASSPQLNDAAQQSAAWFVQFAAASVDLLYPKEARQMTEAMREQHSAAQQRSRQPSTLSSVVDPAAFHRQRILTTSYAATEEDAAASPSHSSQHTATPSLVSILLRPPHAHSAQPSSAPASPYPPPLFPVDRSAADAAFLDSLPDHRWFEAGHTSGEQPHRPPAAADVAPGEATPPPVSAAPAALAFERSASSASSIVVRAQLSACTLHLSKLELDLLNLLYTIADELTSSQTTAATHAAVTWTPRPLPTSSSPSRQPASAAGPLSFAAAAAAVAASSSPAPPPPVFSQVAAPLSPRSPLSPSLSDESDGSDASELFHSVVGAESVFLRPLSAPRSGPAATRMQAGQADHSAREEEAPMDVLPLSDLDSEAEKDDLSAGSADEEVEEEEMKDAAGSALLSSSLSLSRSVVMGRSQELRRSDGRRVTGRSVASLLSSSAMFHSFLAAPPSLRSSTVLPSVQLFTPKPVQPYKFFRSPRPLPAAQSKSALLQQPPVGCHRHWLSFSLSIRRGGLCIHEELVPLPLYDPLDPSRVVLPSSTLPPQSFYLDVGDLSVFAVTRYGGEQVSYVSVRAADATLREYAQVIAQQQRWRISSTPILFKTMADPQQTATAAVRQPPQPRHLPDELPAFADATWLNPVFIGSFILRGSEELHLRETTAVLNLRALTLAFEPHSAWLAKLSDLFTLTSPPYVQTVGEAVRLSADCRSLAAQQRPAAGSPTTGPQPPPPLSDLVHLHFHAFDCAFDFNPAQVQGRAALLLDHFHLHTTVYPHTSQADMDIELRDAALLLLPRSHKASAAPAVSLCEVPPPHLHRLPGFSLSAYLEDVGFARVATADFVDLAVHVQDDKQRDASRAATVVELTNGHLDLLTCSDSLSLALTLAQQLAATQHQPSSSQPPHSPAQPPAAHPHSTSIHRRAGTQEADIGARAEVQQRPQHSEEENDHDDEQHSEEEELEEAGDDEAEEDEEKKEEEVSGKNEELKGAERWTTAAPSLHSAVQALPSSSSRPAAVDVSAAGVRCSSPSPASCSLSLALQVAAEREIERVRREKELNRSISELRRAERGREERLKLDPPQPLVADALLADEEGLAARESEATARWFSRHELDERELREAVDAARERVRAVDDEEEQRRWKREEQATDERLERDTHHRRERQRRTGGRISRRLQPLQPHVLESHIPTPRSSAEEVQLGKGRMGTGRRALKRLQLLGEDEDGDDEDERRGGAEPTKRRGRAAEVELLLYDVSVTWKLFDGQDWTDEPPSPPQPRAVAAFEHAAEAADAAAAAGAAAHVRAAAAGPVWRSSVDDFRLPLSLLSIDEGYVAAPSPSQPSSLPPSSPSSSSWSSSSSRSGFVTPALARGYRHTDRVMELRVSSVAACVRSFAPPPSSLSVPLFSLSLDVSSVEVLDCVATSHFRKFLGPDPRALPHGEQRSGRHGLLRVEAKQFRADAWEVLVDVKPIRLNVDQDAAELLLQLLSRVALQPQPQPFAAAHGGSASPGCVVRLFRVSYPVRVCVDYLPHRLSLSALSGGDYAQLVHLFPIEHLRLSLVPVTVRDASVEAAASAVLDAWVDDLSRHQLHRYLSSIQPLRSLVNVGHGVVDCVVLPLEQLRHPRGRLARGVRKGVGSLVRRVTVEGLNVLMTIAGGAQLLLKEVERAVVEPNGPAGGRLSPAASTSSSASVGGLGGSESSPKTLSDGLQRAYVSLSRALQVASHQLVAVPSDEWRKAGGRLLDAADGRRSHREGAQQQQQQQQRALPPLPAHSLMRAMPSVLLGPMIGLTDGLRKAMMAVQNTVQPSMGQERDERLKRPSE